MEKNTYNLTGYETFYGKTKEIKFDKKEYGALETSMLLQDFPKNYNFDTCTVYYNENAMFDWNSEDNTDSEIANALVLGLLAYCLGENEQRDKEFKFEVVLQNECGSENLIITQ